MPYRWRHTLRLGLLLLTLSGCAQQVWTRPGLTEAAWRADQYSCERDARMSVLSFGGGIAGAIEASRFQGRCLEAKGYYRVQ